MRYSFGAAKTAEHSQPARSLDWLWVATALSAIVLLAFGLRVYAVGWGLPYTDHPDEPSAANTVLRMIRRGDWDPRFFEKPSLYYYLLRLVFSAYLRYGFATGLYSDMAQIPLTTDQYLPTPSLFIWGRMLSVTLGALTVIVLFLIGRRWWDVRIGLAAAALLAVSPFHMRESQYITVDATTTLVALLALGAALRLLDEPSWGAYALAGLAAGLAASAKYNAGAVVFSIVVAHGLVWRRDGLRRLGRLGWAGFWSLLGFLLATPYALLTFRSFIGGIARQYGTYSPAASSQPSHTWPILEYLQFFWGDGLRPLVFLAMLAGLLMVVARRDRPALVMLAFVPTQLIFFLAQNRHFDRNLLPIIPPLLLVAAIGLAALVASLARLLGSKRAARVWWTGGAARSISRLGMLAGTLALSAAPLLGAIQLTRFEALPYSKVRAGNYVRERLPKGAPIAVALHPAQWPNQPFITPVEDVAAHTAGWYRAQGYRYLIANTKDTNSSEYQKLREQSQVLEVFPGDKQGQPGPPLEALDLGLHPDQLAIERQPAVFGGELALLGFQRGAGALRSAFSPLPGARDVRAGQALQLNLYWQSQVVMPVNYAIFLHLVDPQGQTVAQRDTVIRQNDDPTTRWQLGELALDLADLPIPAGLAPGDYRLELGVYRMDTLARLPLAANSAGALALLDVAVK